MPKNAAENTAISNLGTAADTLADRLAAFTTAQTTAATAAPASRWSAQSALDAAWVDYKAKGAAFDGLMLVAPAGYTPPA